MRCGEPGGSVAVAIAASRAPGRSHKVQATFAFMTEEDYITELKARWPRTNKDEVLLETIALTREAVQAFPSSPKLWVIRGDLLQLATEDCPYPLEESLVCYKRAIEIDPQFAEAWESAAHFYDAVMTDEQAAAPYFTEFERLKGHHVA